MNNATRRSARGTEVSVEDFAVANDVPLCEDRESTLRIPGRLDVELFVSFEVVGEFSQELVGHDTALVVREAVLPRLVHLEVIVPPDGELSLFGNLPIERPEAVALTELADCLRIDTIAPVDVVAQLAVSPYLDFTGSPPHPCRGRKQTREVPPEAWPAPPVRESAWAPAPAPSPGLVRRLTSSRRSLAVSTRSRSAASNRSTSSRLRLLSIRCIRYPCLNSCSIGSASPLAGAERLPHRDCRRACRRSRY